MGVGACAVAGLHRQVRDIGRLETGCLDGNGIMTDGKQGDLELAACARGGGALLVRFEAKDGDAGVGNDRAGGIGDRSQNIGGGQLRSEERRSGADG